MSAYDDAVAYLDAEVHPRCDYDIYSDMRDIVDEMEAENAKLHELCADMWAVLSYSTECRLICKHRRECYRENECVFEKCTRELGIEVN